MYRSRSLPMPGRSAFAFVAFITAFVLAGCGGSTIERNADASRRALLVEINPRVQLPEHVFYESVAESWGKRVAANTGLIGAIIGAAVSTTGDDPDIDAYFRQQRIDVGQIFAEEMARALGDRPQIQLTQGGRANRMVLTVKSYGFRSSESFGGKMRIVWDVKAELFDPNGRRLWDKGSNASHAKWPELSINQYLEDPARLVESFHAIAQDMSNRLRSDLLSEHADIATRKGVAYARMGDVPREARMPTVRTAAYTPATVAAAPVPASYSPPQQIQAPAAAPVASGPLARVGASVRQRPQAGAAALQVLQVPMAVDPTSRLQNEFGFWWYVSSDTINGWVSETEVSQR